MQIPIDEATVLNDSIFNDKYDEKNGVLYTDDNNVNGTVVPELIGNMMDSSITIIQKRKI